jgi:formylmethanofuran dehydrogenase subunit C
LIRRTDERHSAAGRAPGSTRKGAIVSALCLTLREPPARRVDLSPLTPDRLAGKTPAQVAALPLRSGNRTVRVDDLFSVSGTSITEIEIRNACDRLDRIGEGMTHGRILVQGAAGAYLGARMAGGMIEVRGDAGAYAATGMSGGLIRVAGAAGDFLGAAIPGDQRGMRGGTVLVGGDAGDRAGDRMRRGLVLIEGRAGDYCASRMLAGTIAVWGPVGRFPGMAMKRGTLLLRDAPALLPTFSDSGRQPLGFLSLLVRSWRALPGRFATIADSEAQVQRYMGDLANDGRGEILVWPWGN